MPSESRQDRIKRLGYRAGRRGFKEADLLIGGFARARLSDMSEAELDEFEALLDAPDQDIYDWVLRRAEPPREHHTRVLEDLRAFAADGEAAWT